MNTFSVLVSDRNSDTDVDPRPSHFYELNSNRGCFYIRTALRTDYDPFRQGLDFGWFDVRTKFVSRFADNMDRLAIKYGGQSQQFLGYHLVRGDPSRKTGDTLWVRFIWGPMWPLLPVLAVLSTGLFWRRRKWPRKQRKTAARVTLILYSLPMAIGVILLILAIVNTHFLGPGEKVMSGRSSHPTLPATSDANGVILKVMTYNIWMGGAYKGAWRFEKPSVVIERVHEIGNLIRRYNPDLVFLQEVVMESGPNSVNQVPIWAEAAGVHAWYFGEDINQGLPFHRCISGNAILSKWPLEAVANQTLSANKSFFNLSLWSTRALWCKTQLSSQNVLLASIHLTTPWWNQLQQRQMRDVLDFIGSRPAILAGDFNVHPDEQVVKQAIDTGFFTAKLDRPYTVSSHEPDAKIDYIFIPVSWKLIEHKVIQTGLSDHMPVLSTYRISTVPDPNS